MTISITFPDALTTRVVTALCKNNGYQAQIPDPNNPGSTIPNPVTPAQFARSVIGAFVKSNVQNHEASTAAQAAATSAQTTAGNDLSTMTVA